MEYVTTNEFVDPIEESVSCLSMGWIVLDSNIQLCICITGDVQIVTGSSALWLRNSICWNFQLEIQSQAIGHKSRLNYYILDVKGPPIAVDSSNRS